MCCCMSKRGDFIIMIINYVKELDKLQNRITPISNQVLDQMPNSVRTQVKLIDEYVTPLFGIEKVENGYFYEGHKLASVYYDPGKKKLVADIFLFIFRDVENALLEKSFSFILADIKDVKQCITLIQLAHRQLYSFVYKDEEN